MSQKQVVTRPGGTVNWIRDATANDSSKDFTVPTGKQWQVAGVWGYLACTATVGSRLLRIDIYRGANVIWQGQPATLTASQLGHVMAVPGTGVYTRALGNNTGIQDCLPSPCILEAGDIIRVSDAAGVDAAADDLIVNLHYIEYEA